MISNNEIISEIDEVLLYLFTDLLDLSEGFVLLHVVLEMAAKVYFKEVSKICDVVPRSSAHL